MRALLTSLVFATTSYAADFVVVTNSDSGPGSLRQAILDANAAGGGQITFSNIGALIILSNQLPALTNQIQILGPGPDHLSIDGRGPTVTNVPIFTNVIGNSVMISGLQLTNCSGAIDNFGTLILSNCAIVNGHSGGGDVPGQYAPGIYNAGTITASHCVLAGNYALSDGRTGVAINNSGIMTLAFCAISNNWVSRGVGSGIYNSGNLTADNCLIAGNGVPAESAGGGIYNGAGTVVLRDCSMTNNAAVNGGGIWNGAWLAMTNCTLAGNHAGWTEGPQPGGGLFNRGYATLQNTTVSGNRTTPAGVGAGIWNDGVVVLFYATIASNHIDGSDCYDTSSGAGIWSAGVVRSRNSIFAANYSTLACPVQGVDFYGNLDSLGNNLIQNGSGWTNVGTGTGDIIGPDPKLGRLQDNGGPTWTHALLLGSPAIDAGYLNPYDYRQTYDQRGVPRPQGVAVDIGAFEYQFTEAIFRRIGRVYSSLHFQASSPPLKTYTLQSSTNLLFWQDNFVLPPLTATSNGVVEFYVNEYTEAANPKLFFRLKSQ